MNLREVRDYFQQSLQTLYDKQECESVLWRIIEHIWKKNKLEVLGERDFLFEEKKLEPFLEKLKKNIPVQYVLGYEWFGELKIKVNEHVLIPRPETEELCRLALKYINKNNLQQTPIIDIGTGSGCIAVYLKKHKKNIGIDALDISLEALATAKENARLHEVDIDFIHGDILNPVFTTSKKYDIIISNPPYILPDEKTQMSERVYENEPSAALFVTNRDPLQFYKAIIEFAKNHLSSSGKIFLEINNLYANEILSLMKNNSFESEVIEDMYGNERFVIAGNNV